jgi:hypothetical protein
MLQAAAAVRMLLLPSSAKPAGLVRQMRHAGYVGSYISSALNAPSESMQSS